MALTQTQLDSRFAILPNARAVTLTPQNPAASAITSVDARKRPLTEREQQRMNMLGVEGKFAAFLLRNSTLSSTEPENGDKITDSDSSVWYIEVTIQELEGAIWRCLCRKAVS